MDTNLVSFQTYGEVEVLVQRQRAEMKQIMEMSVFGIHKLWEMTETFIGHKELGRQNNINQTSNRQEGNLNTLLGKITFRCPDWWCSSVN